VGGLLIILLLAISPLLAGCGGETTPTPGQQEEEEEEEEVPTPPPEMPEGLTYQPRETGEIQYGGILRYPLSVFPGGFDLHTRPRYGGFYFVPIFNNLVQNGLDYFETAPETLEADLAEDWEVSSDGLSYTFYLRKGVTWHDGTPFTADDVVYSLDKMVNSDTSRVASFFPTYDRSEKVDDHTVKVYLTQPSATFLYNLSDGHCSMLAKHMADVDPQSTDYLIGTGPFMFKSYVPEQSFEMTRNPNYFKKDPAGNQLPYMDGLKFLYASNDAYVDLLIADRVDACMIQMPQGFKRIQDTDPEITFTQNRGAAPDLLALNNRNKPVDDVRVRRAIGLVVDPVDWVTAKYGTLETAQFGTIEFGFYGSFFFTPWQNPQDVIDEFMGWDQPMEDRIAEAQQLIADAGYPNGAGAPKLRFVFEEGHLGDTQSATYIGDQIRRHLNIEVELNAVEYAEVYEVLAAGEWEITEHQIFSFLGDPSGVVGYFATDSVSNMWGYSNPEFDRMIEEIDVMVDSAARRVKVQEMERILLTDLPTIAGTVYGTWWGFQPRLHNERLITNAYGAYMRYEDVWIEE